MKAAISLVFLFLISIQFSYATGVTDSPLSAEHIPTGVVRVFVESSSGVITSASGVLVGNTIFTAAHAVVGNGLVKRKVIGLEIIQRAKPGEAVNKGILVQRWGMPIFHPKSLSVIPLSDDEPNVPVVTKISSQFDLAAIPIPPGYKSEFRLPLPGEISDTGILSAYWAGFGVNKYGVPMLAASPVGRRIISSPPHFRLRWNEIKHGIIFQDSKRRGAPGDSGGPMYALDKDGIPVLIGLTTSVIDDYSLTIVTDVRSELRWMLVPVGPNRPLDFLLQAKKLECFRLISGDR